MRVKELFEGRGPDLLNRCEGGPTEQKLTDEGSADIIKPLYNLRKIGFQQGRHPLTDPCAVIDQATSVLHQILQRPCLGIIWLPSLEPVPMMAEQLKQIVRILRIIFGPAGRECLTVLGQRGGVDRVEDQKVVLQERIDQWPARLLQADSDLLAGKTGAQRSGPCLKLFWGVLEDEVFFLAGRSIKQTDIMLGI